MQRAVFADVLSTPTIEEIVDMLKQCINADADDDGNNNNDDDEEDGDEGDDDNDLECCCCW